MIQFPVLLGGAAEDHSHPPHSNWLHGNTESLTSVLWCIAIAVQYAMTSGVKNKQTGYKKKQAASPTGNSGSMAS